MRVLFIRRLEYEVHQQQPDSQHNNQLKSKADKGFAFAFKLHREKCNLTDLGLR